MAIFRKGQKAYSIFHIKCPRCHESDMFATSSMSFKAPFEMKERCDKCNEDFFPEPGYYYGAMFLSYIFTAWFSIGFVLFFHWLLKWSTAASFALLIGVLLVFFVYIFRVARAMYINIHVSYDPHAIEKAKNKGMTSTAASHYGK
ncbi:MAG: DUF983 domain-containing protein [Bacteroidetes bacterium]|nr:MAG: DUF983 domain-containing protein [Bacteroidota bacterium]PTM11938.1 MAG: DUF983 domain-containing protein [Bacteroidota bacterium]